MENGDDGLLQCYNRGCGKKYSPNDNKDDSCCHHPGDPVFHDAYKGWSCCSKKCTDFTEFLNIKGCTRSKHSNVKPPEPEKPVKNVDTSEVIEVKPIVHVKRERPPFASPLTTLVPEIAPLLKQQVLKDSIELIKKDSNEIAVGTNCKNGGCKISYEGPETNETNCIYHPGVPIFHEGLKYWSCCTKRTTDFNAFLEQVGCTQGKHIWIKTDDQNKTVQCRWDFHQTGSFVVVAVYAKQYCIKSSTVELNPIRLKVHLVFPEQFNSTFDLDVELQGVVDVKASQASMYNTKVEIKLKKADPCSWSKLGTPRKVEDKNKSPLENVSALTPQVDAIDLDDL